MTDSVNRPRWGTRSVYDIQGTWSGTKTISLRLPMSVRLYHGFNDSVAIERGPLVYALKIGSEWRKVKDNPQFADWEVFPTTPWNYALQIDREHPERSVTSNSGRSVSTLHSPGIPRDRQGQGPAPGRLEDRQRGGRSAAVEPRAKPAPLEEFTLIPYGCTDLRITEFPTLAPH